MNDEVYLKREIKKDKLFEAHPNLVFGLMLLCASLLCVASLFCLSFLPFWVLALLWVIVLGALIYYIIKKNDNTNLTKSSAFVRRDGVLYYIRLGYSLEGDVPVGALKVATMGPFDAVMAARAHENTGKTKYIQEIRNHKETFSNYLTEILNSPLHPLETNPNIWVHTMPNYVVDFCEMCDPKLERQTSDWLWISYYNSYTNNKRVTQKFRNVYDLPLEGPAGN